MHDQYLVSHLVQVSLPAQDGPLEAEEAGLQPRADTKLSIFRLDRVHAKAPRTCSFACLAGTQPRQAQNRSMLTGIF